MKQKLKKSLVVGIAVLFMALTIMPMDAGDSSSGAIKRSFYGECNGEWNRTFGGGGLDRGCSVQQTTDGGYIIGGYTESFIPDERDLDFWLIKTDANGNEEWNKTFGGIEREKCYCVEQTRDSGYILMGTKYVILEWSRIWLIKTDEYGNEQWNKTYGDKNRNGVGYCVQQTQDNGYILVGCTHIPGQGESDIWLIKTDDNGNVEWSKIFGGNKSECGVSVQQTDDGGYIIGGNIYHECRSNAILIKTDEHGNEEWKKTFEGALSSVQQTKDSGYIIGGSIRKWNRWLCYAHLDIWMIKTDSMGNMEWEKSFGTNYHETGEYAKEIIDGGFILLGETRHFRSSMGYNDHDAFDIWLIKTDFSGNLEWIKKIGRERCYEYAHEVHQTLDGSYIIVGEIDPWDTSNIDVLLIKTAQPTLKIELIPSFDISAVIKNTGKEDLSNIEWSIYIDGMVFTGRYTHGTIASLPAGSQKTINSDIILGFGPVTIIIIAEESAMLLHCFLLGYLKLPI